MKRLECCISVFAQILKHIHVHFLNVCEACLGHFRILRYLLVLFKDIGIHVYVYCDFQVRRKFSFGYGIFVLIIFGHCDASKQASYVPLRKLKYSEDTNDLELVTTTSHMPHANPRTTAVRRE